MGHWQRSSGKRRHGSPRCDFNEEIYASEYLHKLSRNPLLSTLLHITLGVVVRDENVARIWSYEGTRL